MVMGDQNGGRFRLPKEGVKVLPHTAGHIGIQIAERFVQAGARLDAGQRARQCDALLLPAR